MWTKEEIIKMGEYEDRILELIDRVDEFTRSDLQGAVGALVITMLLDMRKYVEDKHMRQLQKKSAERLQKELDNLLSVVGAVKGLERVAAQVDIEYQDGSLWNDGDKETMERWINEIEKRVYNR